MNDRLDLDRRVADWLQASAPPRAADRVLTFALDRVADTDQERSLGLRRLGGSAGQSSRARWVILGALLATALIGAGVVVGALRHQSAIPLTNMTNGWVAYAERIGPEFRGAYPGWEDARNGPAIVEMVREGVVHGIASTTTSDPIRAICPAFSPDGTQIAYAEATNPTGIVNNTWAWGERAVVVRTLTAEGWLVGAAVRIPLDPSGTDPCPTWSPDGQALAFLTGEPAVPSIASADGSGTIDRITSRDDLQLEGIAWAPDGRFVAVAGSDGLWLVPIDGSAPRQLDGTPSLGDISWSPDGSHLAAAVLSGDRDLIHVVALDGTIEDVWDGLGPAWSPDDERIAYSRPVAIGGYPATSEIVVGTTGGRDPHVIALPSLGVGATYATSGLVWSPDGSRLAFVSGANLLISVSASGDPAPDVLVSTTSVISDTGLSWQPVRP